jgi:hypothetical protein
VLSTAKPGALSGRLAEKGVGDGAFAEGYAEASALEGRYNTPIQQPSTAKSCLIYRKPKSTYWDLKSANRVRLQECVEIELPYL